MFKSVIQLYFHKTTLKQNFHVYPHNSHKEMCLGNAGVQTQLQLGFAQATSAQCELEKQVIRRKEIWDLLHNEKTKINLFYWYV